MISGRSAFASSAAALSIASQSTAGMRGSTAGNAPVGAAFAHMSVGTSMPTGRGRPETSSVRIACIAAGASEALSIRREVFVSVRRMPLWSTTSCRAPKPRPIVDIAICDSRIITGAPVE